MKNVYLLLGLSLVILLTAVCSNSTEQQIVSIPTSNTHQSCITLANKIKTLNISPKNIVSPQNTELPEDSKIIDIYEILEIDGKSLMCRAKAKISQGNYPIYFYLITENKREYIILESQGKRKWIFKWLND